MPEQGPVPRPRSRPKAPDPSPPTNGNGAEPTYLDPRWRRYRAALEELAAARREVHESGLVLGFEQAAWAEHSRQFLAQVRVEPLGLGYQASATEGVGMTLTRLRESRGDLTAEIAVRRHGEHLLRQRLNLSSGQARLAVAKVLAAHPFGGAVAGSEAPDWREVLEQVSVQVLDAQGAGATVETIGNYEPMPEAPRVIDPYLPMGPTLLWGPQGSGKSTLAVAVVVTLEETAEVIPGWLPRIDARCLVLDWESSRDEWNDRIRRVAAGAGCDTPHVAYIRMRQPLADSVEQLAEVIDRQGIGFLVIDSFEKAAGARAEGSTYEEKAERVFLALDRLARPSLLLDHVAGDDLRGGLGRVVVKSIGSTLKGAWARATYDLKRDPDRSTDERVELLLHNVKINDGRPLLPYEFAIRYDGERGRIWFERSSLTSPELLASLPQAEQLRRVLLHGGARATKDLAEELGVTDKQVRAIVSRDHGRRFVRLPDGTIGLTQRGVE